LRAPTSGRLYLHIGMHKTGTSTVQTMMARARLTLREAGLTYVGTQINHNDLFLAFADHPEREHANHKRGIHTAMQAQEAGARTREVYAEALSDWGGLGSAVISGEQLCCLSAQGVDTLASFLQPWASEIRIVVATRDSIGFSTSMAQELIKAGSTLAAERRSPELARYRARLSPYIDVFGRQAIQAFDFNLAKERPDGPSGAFFDEVVVGSQMAALEPCHVNESLSLDATHLLSAMNERYPVFQKGRIELAGLATVTDLLRKLKGPGFAMPSEWQERVWQASRDDVDWLRQIFDIDYGACGPAGNSTSECSIAEARLAELADCFHEAGVKVEAFLGEYIQLSRHLQANSAPVHAEAS